MRQRKGKPEAETQNFTDAIAENGHSKSMLEQIAIREREVSAITDRLLTATPDSIQVRIEQSRGLVEEGILKLWNLLNENAPLAKTELRRHLDEVRMLPSNDGDDWHYVAEGKWDLLGADSSLVSRRQSNDWRLEMVAGARNAPNALLLPFRYELLRGAAA